MFCLLNLTDLFSKHALWAYWHVTDITLLPNGLAMPNNPSTVNAIHILFIHIQNISHLKWINHNIQMKLFWYFFNFSKLGHWVLDWFDESYISFDCVFGQRTSWRNSFDQVGLWYGQQEKSEKSNLNWGQIQFKFMFQLESNHNMSSFEADLKKQILGRWAKQLI